MPQSFLSNNIFLLSYHSYRSYESRPVLNPGNSSSSVKCVSGYNQEFPNKIFGYSY